MDRTACAWITFVVAAAACGGSGGDAATGGGGGVASTSSATGGGGGQHGPPKLVHATLVSGTEVDLVFSEALGPLAGVDARAFRLSGAKLRHPGQRYFVECLGYTSHGEACSMDCVGSYDACPDASAPYCCVEKTVAAPDTTYFYVAELEKLAEGLAPNEIIGTLRDGIQTGACEGDLHLHYREATPGVAAVGGEKLASIAPGWVSFRDAHNVEPERVDGVLPDHPFPVSHPSFTKLCSGEWCTDGLTDEFESDVDCGGKCNKKCANGRTCHSGDDCASMHCVQRRCSP